MRFSLLALAAAAFSAVEAVKFTSQTAPGTTIDLSKGDVQVTWTDASTTQLTTAHLLLVNQAGGHTPFSYDFGEVKLADGKFTISKINLPNGDAYQFELLATAPMNSGILALTQQFAISGTASGATLTLSAGSSGSATAESTTTSTSSSTVVLTLTTSTSTSSGSAGTTSVSIITPTGPSTTASTTSSGAVATASTNMAVAKEAGKGSLLALAIGAIAAVI